MEELETTGSESPEEESANESMSNESPEQPAEEDRTSHAVVVMETVLADDLLAAETEEPASSAEEDLRLKAVVEALVYVAEEPITVAQMAASLEQPVEHIQTALGQLIAEYDKPEHGFAIREVAGGYRIATKPEHHDAVRAFAKSLKPPLKLSLPALETLAVIAYKQPVTAPEIREIRGVQGSGVLSTLLDRKLIAEAGRKNVIGKPILYKTTKEFLIQFGLKDLSELPTLKEFEEIRRMAFADSEPAEVEGPQATAENQPPTVASAVEAVAPAPAESAGPAAPAAEGQASEPPPEQAPETPAESVESEARPTTGE